MPTKPDKPDRIITRRYPDHRLRVLRAERRLSQTELAARAAMHEARLWRVENCYALPTADEYARLVQALQLAPEDTWQLPQPATPTREDRP